MASEELERVLRTTGAIRMSAVAGGIIHEIMMRPDVGATSPAWELLREARSRIYALDEATVANTELVGAPS